MGRLRLLHPHRFHLLAAALLLALLSCGTSSAQFKRARAAEYPASAHQLLFAAAHAAMIENNYEIDFADPQRGVLVSTYQWYSKDGMRKAKEPRVREGDAVFRIGVEIVSTARGLRVHVDGGAQGYTAGSPVAQRFEHGDPREPFWVEGKIDSLTMAIYYKLDGNQLPPATATAAPAPAQP
jgi:hypothetical protein